MRPWEEYLSGDSHHLEVDAWWSQVIFIVGQYQVTRRDLSLWAAEKDGGAHADSQLHPGYEALIKMWNSVPVESAQSAPLTVPHQHLFALRRFALEVLASDELLEVAWPARHRPERRIIADWPEGWSPIMDRVHGIASIYFANLPIAIEHRDGEAIGQALKLVDDIRLPLSEWHADHLTRSSQYTAALLGYSQIQAIHPGHQHSLFALGYVNHRLSCHSEAEKYLLEAVANDPNHVPSLAALANLYLDKDNFEKARPLYEKVLELDKNHPNARINLTILTLSEKALVPECAISALMELGHYYLLNGLSAGAKSAFEQVLVIDSNNVVAVAELQKLVEAEAGSGSSAT